MITTQTIAELRALLDAAGPDLLPLRHGREDQHRIYTGDCSPILGGERVLLEMKASFTREADAALIVAALNALPALLAEVERLTLLVQ